VDHEKIFWVIFVREALCVSPDTDLTRGMEIQLLILPIRDPVSRGGYRERFEGGCL